MSEHRKPRSRILIAEDDSVSRRALQAFLGKWGYQVVTATDGLEALKILESEDAPALAVLDWMMPGMEGPQVCQRVRRHVGKRYVYILLLTARTQQADLLHGLDSGADDYLTKPFDSHELRARLHVGQRILDLQDRLIEAREELRYRATHDTLTGISNRAAALEALKREYSRHVREGSTFGIILADLDHFKNINDTYGHLCGDAVLKETALRMTSCVRPYDTVGRYGGEEFLIVVASSDGSGTLGLAERIRRAIEVPPVSVHGLDIGVTASFGVAASASDNPLEPPTLLHAADEALYRAKRLGRNRSELAGPSDVSSSPCSAAEPAPVKSESR